jgi:exopolysaccharide production protein ExoY
MSGPLDDVGTATADSAMGLDPLSARSIELVPGVALSVRRVVKRAIDVVLGLALITLSLPVMVIVAAILLSTDPGPILFRQNRMGRGGKPFKIWKFRTMAVGAEEQLNADPALYEWYVDSHHKLPAALDHRINRVGRTLRLTSLDELPQLFNVVGGSMSLVGPRPVTTPELAYYGQDVATVLSVRPGMSGPWQVSGRNLIGYPERARIDITYATTFTISMDARILVQTVGAVIRRNGAI